MSDRVQIDFLDPSMKAAQIDMVEQVKCTKDGWLEVHRYNHADKSKVMVAFNAGLIRSYVVEYDAKQQALIEAPSKVGTGAD